MLGAIIVGVGGCAGASGFGLGLYFAFLALISSNETSSGGWTILDPAPVAVTRGHEFATGGFTSPFSLGSDVPIPVDVVGGALIVALLWRETESCVKVHISVRREVFTSEKA